ncbi:MAG: hypothetical protein FWF25_01390 [Propionibacteriaceae bacterium]|nr:hypothetical protein [Propionibacteriaceae bacterium]
MTEIQSQKRGRVPRWTEFRTISGRVTERQWSKLTNLCQHLISKNRKARLDDPTITLERITNNTLIRVAIELLLEVENSLHGTTEAELLASAKAALNHPANPE